ncbi:MAG: SixA phosphatase family protein [Sphingosinicella sp.]|uniref:SixA phosphatase family protein n=1 Tax=Sphingosinicella sp. TaxID=1917971 RepID=UPI0040377F1B
MKILTLLRHAKSSWADPGQDDFDRPLNARGIAAARRMGREMRALGLSFDAVLSSPARRAFETLDRVAETYGPLARAYDRRVYLASSASLLAIVRETDDTIDRLLLVGHNPGFHMLALLLTGNSDGPLHAELAAKYPTGALAEIELPITRWRDLAEGRGRLTRFIRPRDLDPEIDAEAD